MITFLSAVVLLLLGFVFYGRFAERVFKPDDRETPAYYNGDGVDFVPMPTWKVYMIQLLNIAGTGPIFGAISGALFGPVVYLWIVFGCIFAGAVHDYMTGMLSVRNGGASLTSLIGIYLGNGMMRLMGVLIIAPLVLCGTVFTIGSSGLIALLTPERLNQNFWIGVIVIYYFVATFVPINKLIGKIYPLFGICLISMAIGVSWNLLFKGSIEMPELWQHFSNEHASGTPIWPFMFISVACGAISGFHGTQSPMMARCIKSEKQGRNVFYGAMIAEGLIALVWAAAGVSCYESSQALLEAGGGCSSVVYYICQTTMGKLGCTLAMFGVIVCPITSGDTSYRSARLMLAERLHIDQNDWKKRFVTTFVLLTCGTLICTLDYQVVWRYFAWTNQFIGMVALWVISVYLKNEGKNWRISAVPAMFMSAVTCTYFIAAPECMGLLWGALGVPFETYFIIAIIAALAFTSVLLTLFIRYKPKK